MSELVRPGWDEYFMDIAHVVATRGNCCRRQVAAVIVRDRRIVSTGYNGTPRGITNCHEGGCARCASDTASGEGLGECVCCHAELFSSEEKFDSGMHTQALPSWRPETAAGATPWNA